MRTALLFGGVVPIGILSVPTAVQEEAKMMTHVAPTLGRPRTGTWLAIAFLALSTTAYGQVRSGSVEGTVTDDTGGALPGVTVTLTSPALQVPQLVKVSGSRGEYQFVDLPPGAYRLVYQLEGFSQLIREDIRVTTGFAARVDVRLPVATFAQTVTVTGNSPVIDVVNTRGGATITNEVIAAIPTNLNHQDLVLLAGGTTMGGGSVGGTAPVTGTVGVRDLVTNNTNISYGKTERTNNQIEGIRAMEGEGPDFNAVEEIDVKTYGHTAEADLAGATFNVLFKSGGNTFHGRYLARAQHARFQSNNITDALRAQGIREGNTIKYYADFGADLGGRIIRDKLWFYGAARNRRNEGTIPGFSKDAGPDGRYGTPDDVPGTAGGTAYAITSKLSYQATTNHRFVGFWSWNSIDDSSLGASRFTPYESSVIFNSTPRQFKVEWNGVFSDSLIAKTLFADAGYTTKYRQPDELPLAPNRLDRETGFQTGTSFSAQSYVRRRPWREQLSGGLDYFPKGSFAGSHEISAGYGIWWGRFEFHGYGTRCGKPDCRTPEDAVLGYQLVYDRVAGRSFQPVEMVTKNFPIDGTSRYDRYATWVTDSWRPTPRLSMNLGLRWEGTHMYIPPQRKLQGQFGTSGDFPAVDIGSWKYLTPRFGIAYDLLGNGKTVIKSTYAKYMDEFPAISLEFPTRFNQNGGIAFTTYRWRDLDGNNDYTPGEVNLDPNGPDFLRVTGSSNWLTNPALERPSTHEVSASIERELVPNVSLLTLYVYKRAANGVVTVNALRPYDAYNVAITRRDPGPDGVLGNTDDGAPFTVYDYAPAFRGSNFVGQMAVNGDRDDSFHNLELTVNKRLTGKWFTYSSFLATKNHGWLKNIAETPNDEAFSLDETWSLSYRLAVGYEMPFGVQLSTLYQAYDGLPLQRTFIVRAADPDRGPSLPSSGSITQRMEPYGARRGPSRHLVNLRAAKRFELGGGHRFSLDVDAFNALNASTSFGITTASGPSFGYISAIATPRALRFGVTYEF